jgi:hypothetical protein
MVAAWACAAAAIGTAPAAGRPRLAAAAAGSCTPRHTGVTAKSSRVIVYALPSGIDSYSGGALTTYYACLRPNGRAVAIGQSAAGDGEYPGNIEMLALKITGTFVADESAEGFASAAACSKFEPPTACNNIIKYWLKIADVAARRTVRVFVSGPMSSLVLSATGAAAWVVSTSASSSTLYAIVVHAVGRGSLAGRPVVVDSGQAITSVSFAGSNLRWSNGGQPKSRTFPARRAGSVADVALTRRFALNRPRPSRSP